MTGASESGARRTGTAIVDGVRVSTVEAHQPVRTCIAAMGFGAWLEPFEDQRFLLVAQRLRARVVVVETPGLGETPSHATGRERLALLHGDYGPLARRMLRSALAVTGGEDEETHLLGYSMGASVAAEMAAAGLVAKPASLTLVEPVAAQAWNPVELGRAVLHEGAVVDRYLSETAGVAGACGPFDRAAHESRPSRSLLDQALLPMALCWGRLGRSIDAYARFGGPLFVIRGRDSLLSRGAAVSRLVQRAARQGVDARETIVPGGHGLWQSLPRVERLADTLASEWDSL